jgi:tyrosyl-tRNA synthetase
MGGSDQWGNIVTGTELIRRKSDGNAYALTTKLITKADGSKFGKTEGGNIWLDPGRTSPYKFYQYWLNVSDEDAINFVKIFTLKTKDEIGQLVDVHQQAPNLRKLQQVLAEEITIRVHSAEDYHHAVRASAILFGNSTVEELRSLDEETLLAVFEGVPQASLHRSDYEACPNVTELLTTLTQNIVFPSKGEARKMIQAGAVMINKTKINDPHAAANADLLQDKYLIVQRGKKNYYLLVVN